jgi:hypothetical protein
MYYNILISSPFRGAGNFACRRLSGGALRAAAISWCDGRFRLSFRYAASGQSRVGPVDKVVSIAASTELNLDFDTSGFR